MSIRVFDEFNLKLKKPEMTMAPLIDMVFLLLIFFVVTTTFTKETGIQVDKARATTSQHIHKNLMIISINKAGHYWYDGSRRSLEEIVDFALQQAEKVSDLNIVIVPDRQAEVDPLIRIMDKLRANHLNRFSLGTQLVNE
jgi:biopolymer transport protein ExbD